MSKQVNSLQLVVVWLVLVINLKGRLEFRRPLFLSNYDFLVLIRVYKLAFKFY